MMDVWISQKSAELMAARMKSMLTFVDDNFKSPDEFLWHPPGSLEIDGRELHNVEVASANEP